MNLSNIKDTLTTVCAWITVIGGGVLAANLSGQIVLPVSIVGILSTVVAIALGISQFLSGKNPDGTSKTPTQVNTQNTVGK